MSDPNRPVRLARESAPEISVVIPIRDELETMLELHARLSAVLADEDHELVIVDDGSGQHTRMLLDHLSANDPRVRVLRLTRGFGHQAAVTAGLDHARGSAIIVMDGDLQDPPELVTELLAQWRDGFPIVHAVRRSRSEGPVMRLGAHLFYRAWRAIADHPVVLDSGDFCLMDRRVLDVLVALPERRRFVRDLRSWAGFQHATVPYDRPPRTAGRTRYPWLPRVGLAVEWLAGSGPGPLRIASILGVSTALMGATAAVALLVHAWLTVAPPLGWALAIAAILFVGGVQMITVGILGEYVRIMLHEVRGRPAYLLDSGATGIAQFHAVDSNQPGSASGP